MKHFTQTTANGLHTPPCGSSQSKSTRFSLLTSFLLFFLLLVGSNAAWAEFVTYNGTEFFFWNSHQKINGGQWGHIIADNRNMYLRFHNTSTNATAWSSKETDKGAVQWDGNVWSDSSPYGIHAAKVPAGTWNEVTVVRSWDHTPTVNETGGTFTLQSGKNYIGPGDDGLGVYTPRFYLPGNSALSGNDWTWNGNGTVYTGVAELSLSAGTTYKFKITPAGASDWGTEANMDHYDSEGSNVTCTDGYNKECWFTLSEAATVRIAFDGQKITVNTVSSGGDPEPDPEPISEVTPVIHGDGLPGLNPKNSGNWDSNTIEMLEYGEDHTFYAEFLNVPATSDNSYRFKIDVNEEGDWWSGAMCNSNVSQANSNVEMVTDDDRISFKMPFEGDVYVFYKSDNDNDKKVWIVAVPKEIGAGSGSNARMHTDLIMDGTNWIDNGINLVRNNNAAVTYQYVTSYIAPACTSDEMNGTGGKKAPKVRFDIKTSSVQVDKPSDLNLALTTQIRRVIYLWNSGSGASSVKRYVIPSYPNHSSDDGWKVWCHDGNNDISGNLVNGSVTVQIGGNKDVKYFITNSSSCTGPSGSAFKSNTVHTVNSFGGCYVDKSASINNVTFKSDHQVYTRNDAGVYKLGDLAKPIVADNDCRGIFRLADGHGDKTYDVTFTFDGGVITINAVEHVTPAATYTVILHPNNGGDNIVRENVPEGSNSSAAALNLAAITYGAGTATWYTNPECTAPFSTVTGNMDLYAKWGVSGNYWLVGDQWMYDTGSSWNNGENPAFTTTDGVATVTFIAPMGRNRFEIIKDNNWGQKINNGNYAAVVNSASPVAISVADGHMEFTLDEMKKVTIIYDGKVSVRAEAYDIHKTGWNIAGNSGLVGQEWNNSACPMDNNGEKILRNINTGNYEFKITPVGSWGIAAVNQFSAANVDKDNSTSNIFRNWTSHLFGSYKDGNEYKLPMNNKKDRNVCIQLTNDMAINGKADIKIAFDGAKITVNVLPKYTVTFKDGETTLSTVQVFDGGKVTAAVHNKSGYDFVKWHEDGSNTQFDFANTAITGNLDLYGEWEYNHISSVSLNESEHTTWVGNSNFTLTLTKDPEDLIAQSVVWSSNNESVATVSNGTVHIEESAGITEETVVRITCTVTDQHGTSRSAYCDVTVAPCEMTTDNLYNMNVTGYNSSTGNSATLTGLWNSSEPATITVCNVRIGNEGTPWYAYDNSSSNENTNGSVLAEQRSNADVDKWQMIAAGTTNSIPVYYLKNMATGKYMFRESSNDNSTTNSAWYTRAVKTSKDKDNSDFYKFYSATDTWGNDVIVSLAGATSNSSVQGATDYVLSREHWVSDRTWTWTSAPEHSVAAARGSNEGGNNYKGFQSSFVNIDNEYPNPAYIPSQMNSSYYRMNTNATVQANLAAALVKGAVITVSLYADAATSVKLTKTDGTEIATIDLSADAALDYTYTVNTASLLLGESAFIIKAADNHAGIASIEVSRMHAVYPDDPALAWDVVDLETTGITQSALGGNIVHTASAAGSTGAISYASSNTAVADIEADGTVLPHMAGSTTITATIEEAGCYGEASITYTITLTEPTLAELIAADAGEGITLTHDYAENIVIDKAVTINGAGHAIGNLTVEMAGDLTLSGALTVNDFSIYAKAGNTTIPAASGQVRNAANLTANGNAYFYYTVDPSGTVHYGWYDFTVPFRVNVMTGIKGIQNEVLKENFVNETDYAIMEHLGNKQAAREYSYKKFRGIMEPCRLYSITLDDDFNYNTIRFQKADGALAAGNDVTLNAYDGIDTKHSNWNGVGNGTLHHADVEVSTVGYIQVYQSGDKTFLPVNNDEYSLVVGSAFMVQQAGTMTLNQASHDKLLAPRRAASAQATAIQIASEGKPFSDQLYITADELAGQGYTQGVDVAKAGNIGNVNVPQIWTNAYNTSLCAHEAQLIDGEAQYTLSLYAPANGTYTLTSKNIPEGYTLYLTQNGNKLWDMSDTYVLDLTKGTTTEYGLLLVENYKMPTAVDNIYSNTDETTKIMRNGILYILQNGKVFNAQGARVK